MKYGIVTICAMLVLGPLSAQKTVQLLQPTRLSIFKNGTFFIQREASITVNNQQFYIPAPQNVLLGTYWVMAGKEAPLHSIVVKSDSFRIKKPASTLYHYLEANLGKEITLHRHTNNAELAKVSGKLLAFNKESDLLTVQTNDGKTWVASAADFNELVMGGNTDNQYWADSITDIAKVILQKPVAKTQVATLSLEKGIQWYPSYLLRINNAKEAQLEMKATIINSATAFTNTLVDIIIGSPEMFYGKQLDPVCSNYLSGDLLENQRMDNMQMMANFKRGAGDFAYSELNDGAIDQPENKDGEKLEDLYYYQLGKLDLESFARVVVPILATDIAYEDIYTADLGSNSASFDTKKVLDVFHGYRINNNTVAPFTTGSVLIVNQQEQPMAQAQLKYTPVKGSAEITLSKAIDVQLKNEEVEIKREENARTAGYNSRYDKVTYSGKISVVNLQNKKITLRIRKELTGVFLKTNTAGSNKKIKDDGSINPTSLLEWELSIEPGGKKEITYDYFGYKSTL